ncbi:cation diffusion facilitator family transporter [Chloroflexota bacterium]
MFSTKLRAARLSVAAIVGLVALKVVVGWLSGSISMLAQATDSLLDLFAVLVTLSAVIIAERPADEKHPYGHGKVEEAGGVVQGALIFAAGGLIIYSSVQRILGDAEVEMTEAGMGVMLVSIIVSILLAGHLRRIAANTGSVALEANASNIAADVYSALAVLLGLLVVRLTGANDIDSAIAIAVSMYILTVGYRVTTRSLAGLLDASILTQQETAIKACLEAHGDQVAGYHRLRTRRSGSERHIDFHLVMDAEISLEEAHAICDRIEAELEQRLPRSDIIIHCEPCDGECGRCLAICARRRR